MSTPHDGGLLVVRRINWFEDAGQAVERTPAVALSHQEILTVYRGFEGEAWPDCELVNAINLQNGLASLNQFKLVEEYYNRVSRKLLCDMLYIGFDEDLNPPPAYTFLGYDYGFYLSEAGVFSSLFHEVIYGMYSEMRQFSGLLNDHLLLPTVESAKELELTRNSLLAVGADLERYEQCQPVVIYGFPRNDQVSPENEHTL